NETRNKNARFPSDDIAVQGQNNRQNRYADHNRNILTNKLFGDDKRSYQCCSAENKQCIENIAANGIGNGQFSLPGVSSFNTDRQLWRAGSKSDNGEADNQSGYAKICCQ